MSDETQSRRTKEPMTKNQADNPATEAFWKTHPDPTQAAVHLALQWLAFVYPASELQIDRTLKGALPYADADLSARWSQFLDEEEVAEHVQALEWLAATLSEEQLPFLIETAWRLLLVDHELPTHVPLALRILGRVLSVEDTTIQTIGESVFREYTDDDDARKRAPLLPVDPRYLDRIEWRLHGHSATTRIQAPLGVQKSRSFRGFWMFGAGSLVGAMVVVALVFGPLQLGRVKVPIMLHDGLLLDDTGNGPQPLVTAPASELTPSQTADSSQDGEGGGIETADSSTTETVLPAAVNDPEPETPPSVEPEETALPESLTIPESASSPSASEPETAQRTLMAVTASILNVREAPDVSSEVLIKLAQGDRVWAYPSESVGLWMQVRVDGLTGYASTRFLASVE